MAILLRADGTCERREPKGRKWTLAELQAAVGGDIERMPGVAPLRLVLNEDGVGLGLPVNAIATALVRVRLAEIGRPLRYVPTLRGDVLLMEKGDRGI